MKRIGTTIIAFCIFAQLLAQSITVSSFKLLDTDLTANTAGTMEIDQNGETAALIKVVTTQTGFTFDGGALGIVKTKQTPGEVWVYIPRGSKKISIKHSQLGVLRDYYFPIGIEAAKTYEMILVTGEFQTIVKQTSNSQYLVFKVTPADAVVELDNEILPISDGFAQKFVKLGTYNYRIQAQNYHTAAGKVDVDDPNKKKVIEVTLKPAFGWIEIPANEEFNGAQVFIDNKLEGTIPMKSKNLSSGEHNVKIVKTLYHPFSQSVVIKDNETTKVNPLLSANYSEVTITVDNDADIYINEEKKGSGSWSGKLASGSYLLEAKKEGHRSTKQNVDVSSAQPLLNIKLTTPAPIYGEANITSTPTMADVYIDGTFMGQTPLYLPAILKGDHKVLIKHDGFNDFLTSVTIFENTNFPLDVVLDNRQSYIVRIDCNVRDAIVYIDGEKYGRILDLTRLESGNHDITVVAKGYKDYVDRINTEAIKDKIYKIELEPTKKTTTSWEKIILTSNSKDVRGMKEVGDVTEKYYISSSLQSIVDNNYKRCLKRIKKNAAKLGASIVLLGEQNSGTNALGGVYIRITATAYK